VQGVYYRASALQEAQKLGLTGWVRNCFDGSVEAVAEGPRDKIDHLIAWCKSGPPGARVTDIDVQWESAEHVFRGFSIVR
jgi:acylphosphatase